MSTINLQLNTINDNSEIKLNFMPAQIKLNHTNAPVWECAESIENYFNQYGEELDGVYTNAFRGYPIQGCKFDVPAEFKGIVFNETKKPVAESSNRTFGVDGTFNQFTYWNYDRIPSKNDALCKSMDWIDYSKILHKPIDPKEFENFQLEEEKSKENIAIN